MRKIIISALAILVISSQAYAHGGGTDQYGGHNCSQKSIDKGLCYGYHYHNGKSYANDAEGHKGHQEVHEHKAKIDNTAVVKISN